MPLSPDTLPHRRLEAWKWTDVRTAATDGQAGLSAHGLPHFTVPDGVLLTEQSGETFKTDSPSGAPMADLARRFGGSVWEITVPEGVKPTSPLMIDNLTKGHARIRITVEKGAQLEMIETLKGAGGGFSNLDMTLKLKAGAKLSRLTVQDDPADHIRIATTHITAWDGAEITQHCLSFGGALSRLETRVAGMGKHISAVLNGAYLLSGTRHCDMTSYIDLASPDCTIRQAVKGVVTDKARGVFQGKFHVRRPAQKTDAEMRHDALMLSETSEVRSKPELEIYADDVACAHGNTLGQLDESALFYMRQRGLPAAQARALLTEAFLAEVFDDIESESLRESVIAKLRTWLERQS
jgi:Fe-S cluster assembly protein SufD